MKNLNCKLNIIQLAIIKLIDESMCSDKSHFDTPVELSTDEDGG